MANKYTDLVHKIRRVDSIFVTSDDRDITFTFKEKLVLWTLGEHAHQHSKECPPDCDKDGVCWPGQTLLASETFLSQTSVQRAVQNLVYAGFVTVAVGFRGGFTYQLRFDAITAFADATQSIAKERKRGAKTIRRNGKVFTDLEAEPAGNDELYGGRKWSEMTEEESAEFA